uniref:Uncharacterized protein n=1 Tax=Oryza glumipatula TaxID=40148 RepID=A0A0D9ZPN5_9ORYZ
MESGTRDVSDSTTDSDQRAGAVDPVVAIDPVFVEAAAMDHAVIIVDAGQTSSRRASDHVESAGRDAAAAASDDGGRHSSAG